MLKLGKVKKEWTERPHRSHSKKSHGSYLQSIYNLGRHRKEKIIVITVSYFDKWVVYLNECFKSAVKRILSAKLVVNEN